MTGRRTQSAQAGRGGAFSQKTTAGENRQGGSASWIPFASCCTTGQFMDLRGGYIRHCGPTAAVNVIRTLEKTTPSGQTAAQLFLLCADIGKQMHIYWNREILGQFGGTSNFLTPMYLRRCLRAAGLEEKTVVRFHPWITPDAVEEALEAGSIVYLQVYRHPKYKNHHMLCYACRTAEDSGKGKGGASEDRERGREGSDRKPVRQFMLADGWSPYPVWVDESGLGHGHFLTIDLLR